MSQQLSNDLLSLKIERTPPEHKSGTRWRTIVAGGAATLASGVVAYAAGIPYLEAKFFRTKVDVTEVAMVSPAQAQVELNATGYVVPQITARIGAKIIGRVARTRIKEGSRVKAGEVMFELDLADQKSAIASARARYAASSARASASRAQMLEVQQQLAREKKLVATGAVAPAQSEDLTARVASMDATARAAETDALAQKAEVKELAVGLGNLTIVAPIDGTVVTKPVEAGAVVNSEIPLTELVDFDSLLIEADVPEAKMGSIKKDGPCEVVFDAIPNQRIRAVVVEVSPRLNRAKATGTVKVKLVDATPGVLPEMSARVSFLAKPLEADQMKEPARKVVPTSALAERAGSKVVFAIEGERVRMQSVELGAPFGSGFELKHGPEPGTFLVRDPSPALADGQAIKRNR
ncbi:efflux RND transporter periplasmic adaptor subunit [Pendulispora rubella]|uniref:Efflux RND transporter periplasmic adaptor subunit n=1 Tax=Pendulispora rubella TaxID=2741070 RepID=A0ABZ2KUV8_9BACT